VLRVVNLTKGKSPLRFRGGTAIRIVGVVVSTALMSTLVSSCMTGSTGASRFGADPYAGPSRETERTEAEVPDRVSSQEEALTRQFQRNWDGASRDYRTYMCVAWGTYGPSGFRQQMLDPMTDLEWSIARAILGRECNELLGVPLP